MRTMTFEQNSYSVYEETTTGQFYLHTSEHDEGPFASEDEAIDAGEEWAIATNNVIDVA